MPKPMPIVRGGELSVRSKPQGLPADAEAVRAYLVTWRWLRKKRGESQAEA